MSETAQQVRILFLHAQTAVHPGSGTSLGAIDLPVNRERHTQWPSIPSTSLKGVLRHACWEAAGRDGSNELLLAAFGPESPEASDHAGAIALTDARLLAFPVRSLKGVFAWITCPAVLERFTRDLAVAGFEPRAEVPSVASGQVLCNSESLLIQNGKMLLEEFEFARIEDAQLLKGWPNLIARAAHPSARERVKTHLAVLADDDFTYFVRNATEIVARIGLDYELKTVRAGALFYQEFIPAESVFYAVVLANRSRRKDDKTAASALLGYVEDLLSRLPTIQVGGDETIGKGLCFARLADPKEATE